MYLHQQTLLQQQPFRQYHSFLVADINRSLLSQQQTLAIHISFIHINSKLILSITQIIYKMQFTTVVFGVLSSLAFAQSSSAAASPGVPTQIGVQCTSTITTQNPVGCVLTAAAATSTSFVDCQGCVLSTKAAANGFFGHGPVCFGGRKTTAGTATGTVFACSESSAA